MNIFSNIKEIPASIIASNGYGVVKLNEGEFLVGAFSSNKDCSLIMEYGFLLAREGISSQENYAFLRVKENEDMMFEAALISELDLIKFMQHLRPKPYIMVNLN